jgi:hypothetical protein
MVAAQVKKNRSFFSLPTSRFPYWQGYLANPKLHTQELDKSYHICWLRVFNLISHFEEYLQVLWWDCEFKFRDETSPYLS